MNKCTSVAGHFDGHAEALKGYMWHRLMQHIQGYSQSHWMPPSGNYSLYCPGGLQGDRKQIKSVICTHFDGRFDGHCNAAGLYPAYRLMEEVHGFHKSH